MDKLLIYTPWIISSADFVSKQSGNWNDPNIWNIKGIDGNLYPSIGAIPVEGNNVWIEASHTITCTQNEGCKDLNLNTTQDVIRINTGAFKLDIHGNRGDYSGTYATAIFSSTNAGIAGWITGTLRFKGLSRVIVNAAKPISASSRSAGYTMEIDVAVGQKLQIDTVTIRCGFLVITAGELEIIPYNSTSYEVRISGNDYTAQPGDGINSGSVYIKSNGKLTTGRLLKNNPTTAKNGLNSFIIETGGVYTPTQSGLAAVPCESYLFSGTVAFIQTYAQFWITKGSYIDVVDISAYTTVIIGGSNTKTLATNTTINTKLIRSGSATLALSTFTLSYGINADLEISDTMTSGLELPTSGSGLSIPRNLIIAPGKVYTVVGIKNIRGIVILGAGASITGIVNQNQP